MNSVEDALGLNDQPSKVDNEAKYNSPQSGLGDNSAESVIAVVAYVTLVLGILGSLIYGIVLMDHKSTTPMGWCILIGGTLSSIITWAFLMVIANISNNIRQIKYELRKKNAEK